MFRFNRHLQFAFQRRRFDTLPIRSGTPCRRRSKPASCLVENRMIHQSRLSTGFKPPWNRCDIEKNHSPEQQYSKFTTISWKLGLDSASMTPFPLPFRRFSRHADSHFYASINRAIDHSTTRIRLETLIHLSVDKDILNIKKQLITRSF